MNTTLLGQVDRLSTLSHSVTGTYQYSYDALDRITQEINPDNLITSFQYDAIGRLTESTWNQESTSFQYDAASRLTGIEAPVMHRDVALAACNCLMSHHPRPCDSYRRDIFSIQQQKRVMSQSYIDAYYRFRSRRGGGGKTP